MVAKTIDLVINTSRGEKNVKKLHQLAQQVEKVFGNINKLKINVKTDPAQKAIEKLNAELTKGKGIVDTFMNTNSINNFKHKISGIKEEMNLVRKAFEDAGKATDRQNAATTLLAGNFKALRLEATAFAMASGTDPKKTLGSVGARLKEIEKFPKTIMAGNQAMSMLKRMQELTVAGSKDFLLVSKAIGKQLEINANIQLQAKRAATPMPVDPFRITQKALPAAGQTSGTFQIPSAAPSQIKAIEKSTKERLRAEKKVTEEANKQLKRERDRKKEAHRRVRNIGKIRRGRMQERMLGAGFPMLFGGGAGSVAGSLAGSMLAPAGMGFGAQIFGSAVGTVLEQNLQKVHAIGDATKHVNLDALEESGIRVNSQLEDAVENLRMMNKESQAQELISQEVANQTGTVKGTNEDIADLLGLLGREWKNFTTIISSTLGILSVPFVAALTLILRLVNGIFWVVNKILSFVGWLSKEAIRLIRVIPGAAELLEKIDEYVDNMNNSTQELRKQFNGYIRDLQTQEQAILRRIELGDKEAAIQEKIAEAARRLKIDKDTDKEDYERLENAIRSLAALEKQEEAVKKLRDLYKTLGQTIEDGLVNAIQAAIDGTKTLGQVASSVFRELSRALIRFGVNALIGGIFSSGPTKTVTESVKPPSAAGLSLGSSFDTSDYGGGFDTSQYGGFANGGRPPVGKPSVVGEKGPELFMPDRAGTIIPNHALGSTNIAINVDASGSSVEGDEQKGRELGQMLSAAIQSELIKQRRPGGLLT
jgi:hypothetical protein